MESEARASLLDGSLVRFGLASAAALLALSATACFQPIQNGGLATPAANTSENPDREPQFAGAGRGFVAKEAIVRLVVGEVACSGTLIGDDLVLTAHHCVSRRDRNGRVVEDDVSPERVTIELGGQHLAVGEVKVRAIVSPDCGYERGEGDIAILVLNRKLVGWPQMTPRLDNLPPVGERVYPWGYGRCALSRDPVHLRPRGDGDGKIDALYRGEFLGQAAICPGDSGGPALLINDEIVGVVSTSVMDHDETTSGLTHYTRLDVWRGLFAAAREISNGASPSELPPYRSCTR